MKREPPGNLRFVDRSKWLDLVFKSKLDAEQKLVASVLKHTCGYSRRDSCYLTDVSDYDISRRIGDRPEAVQPLVDVMIANGWLWDTGIRRGSKKIYALTIDLLAKELYK